VCFSKGGVTRQGLYKDRAFSEARMDAEKDRNQRSVGTRPQFGSHVRKTWSVSTRWEKSIRRNRNCCGNRGPIARGDTGNILTRQDASDERKEQTNGVRWVTTLITIVGASGLNIDKKN